MLVLTTRTDYWLLTSAALMQTLRVDRAVFTLTNSNPPSLVVNLLAILATLH